MSTQSMGALCFSSVGGKLSWQDEEDIVAAGFSLHQEHFEKALEEMHAAQSHTIGAPKVRNKSIDF